MFYYTFTTFDCNFIPRNAEICKVSSETKNVGKAHKYRLNRHLPTYEKIIKNLYSFYNKIVTRIDDFVWGPVMLILLVGTGIFLTVRTRFLTWRNLGYALKSTLSKEARTKSRGQGDVSPFSALTTALAATIGTGNIAGVATAMVSGGPGALVWNFSDIANALMAIPNLICMLLLSGEIAKDVKEFQPEIKK